MNSTPELVELERRLGQVENALADAQARVPALRLEVRQIRLDLSQLFAPPRSADQLGAPASGERMLDRCPPLR